MNTVNLELSKQLKEAGYPQEGSHMSYYREDGHFLDTTASLKKYGYLIASPTADEILDQLPDEVIVIEKGSKRDYKITCYPRISLSDKNVYYESDEEICPCGCGDYYSEKIVGDLEKHESLADAAAKLWLYLKKEKLI